MIPKRTLIDKVLFQNILKNGMVLHTPFFIFRYIRQKTPQYAFVVPKNIAKSAVLRVKLRRLGYNTIKDLNLPPLAGVFFYKNTKNLDFKGDIMKIFDKTS